MTEELFKTELVLATCCPIGTDQGAFSGVLSDCVEQHGYTFQEVKLSEMLRDFELPSGVDNSRAFDVASNLMHTGNAIRQSWERGDALSLLAITEISRIRKETADRAQPNCYFVRSLKHPDEVMRLRKVYGAGFYLIGLHSSNKSRESFLTVRKGMTSEEADALMSRDQSEASKLGQQTRKTFAQADFFLNMDGNEEDSVPKQLQRFLDLVFGYPYHTPTKEEYGMFMAFSASLRSGDLSRQVGASIFSRDGDVIALGCNDVPKSGGGLYWPGAGDAREHIRGTDSNDSEKKKIVSELMEKLVARKLIENGEGNELLRLGMELFKDTRLLDLTEFGRIVHAEMDALLSAARIGAGTRSATLYTTTFPCHNCAKHIVAAGIERVLYVEPYPKSLALTLHSDSICLGGVARPKDQADENLGKVVFEPFTGIGARRYSDLFSMGWSAGYPIKRKSQGKTFDWCRKNSVPRVPLLEYTYTDKEDDAIEILKRLVYDNEDKTQE